MTRSELRWGEPPPGRRGLIDWPAVAVSLRAEPGRWAIIQVCRSPAAASNLARRVRDGSYSAFRPVGAFEAVSRTVDGEIRVYARYVGEPS